MKVDQRKRNSASTRAKKAMAGKAGKSESIFIRKKILLRDPNEKQHFEAAVALGKANDARASGENVVLNNRLSLFAGGRVRAVKVG
jgi:hypothetical protein